MDYSKKYFVASDEGPLGPYTLVQLCERGFDAETYVWCEGMTDWLPAESVDDLAEALAQGIVGKSAEELPPDFDSARFNAVSPTLSAAPVPVLTDECPRNNLVIAIIGIILFFPLGIPAVTNACNVYPSWLQGDKTKAMKQSTRARLFGLSAIAAGLLFNYFYTSMAAKLGLI